MQVSFVYLRKSYEKDKNPDEVFIENVLYTFPKNKKEKLLVRSLGCFARKYASPSNPIEKRKIEFLRFLEYISHKIQNQSIEEGDAELTKKELEKIHSFLDETDLIVGCTNSSEGFLKEITSILGDYIQVLTIFDWKELYGETTDHIVAKAPILLSKDMVDDLQKKKDLTEMEKDSLVYYHKIKEYGTAYKYTYYMNRALLLSLFQQKNKVVVDYFKQFMEDGENL